MPKIKTKSAAKKRFKVTKNGLIKKARTGKGHLLAKKARNRKNNLKKNNVLNSANLKNIKKCLNI